MNPTYFTNPELSKLLEAKRIVSQFDYYWCGKKLFQSWQLAKKLGYEQYTNFDSDGLCQRAFHWSDICLPENAKKIWNYKKQDIEWWDGKDYVTECEVKVIELLQIISWHDGDWQSWLTQELDERV